MDGGLLLDPARLPDPGPRLDVAGDKVHPFNHHSIFFSQLTVDPAAFTFLFARYHEHVVPASDAHYTTSEAREMIRMNPWSLSSRATGPKIRVPRGSLFSKISTAALSSNFMYVPSGRRRPWA
jgi:hypothetical protein